MATVRVPLRASAVALGVSGAAWAIGTPLHPTIFDGDVAGVVHRTESWQLIHLLVMTGSVAAIFGVTGIVASHQGRLGRRGQVVLAVTVVGAVVMAAAMFMEAFAFPVLAVHAPHLLELDGPLLGSILVRGVVAVGGAYSMGLIALGVLTARSDVAPAAGRALTATTAAFVILGLPFVPVAGLLATWAFALTHLWWSWVLWHHADTPSSLSAGWVPAPAMK